jgi:prepilin-type N-terminal cleavage/methylation domain-containing protein
MRRRYGFTLVEMLVASALIVFILVILTETFKTGMDAFRNLKGLGDLEEKLRIASTVLRSDLAADHFEGKKRLSDAGFWSNGPPREGFFRIWQGSPVYEGDRKRPPNPPPKPPPPGTAYYLDGIDGNTIRSYIATDHILHFTVKRRGNRREEFAAARVPYDPRNLGNPDLTSPLLGAPAGLGTPDSRFQDAPGTYASQWYEVAYFLRATNETTDGNVRRFALYRRQRLIVPDNSTVNLDKKVRFVPTRLGADKGLDVNYPEVSCHQNLKDTSFLFFNNPNTITVPQRRFGMDPNKPAGQPFLRDPITRSWTYPTLAEENPSLAGSDLLLTDVLSFQVQYLPFRSFFFFFTFQDIFFTNNSTLNSLGVRVFDTWSLYRDEWSKNPRDDWDYSTWSAFSFFVPSERPPFRINPNTVPLWFTQVYALRITLRVWDPKTQQTRQISIVQEL